MVLVVCILATGSVTMASADGQGGQRLSVDDAVRLGLSQNPQVSAGREAVATAQANYLSLDSYSPATLAATHAHGTAADTFLDLGETIDFSGQRRFQAAAANASFRSARYTFQESLLSLEQQIRDAYWTLASAEAQIKIAEASFAEAKRVYELTVVQLSAGAAPRGDVIRSSIDVANAKQAQITARSAERGATFTLNSLLGRRPNSPIDLTVDLSKDSYVPMSNPPAVAELTTQALKKRPLLMAAAEQTRSAAYATKQAQAAHFPDLAIDFLHSVHIKSDTVTLTASFPLFDFGSVSQSIRAARATERQDRALELQARHQVEQQVAQAHDDLVLALQAASEYKRDILDPSNDLLELAQLGYKQGATGILPVIDAEATIRNARVGYINSVLAVHKAQDELFAATGLGSIAPSSGPMTESPKSTRSTARGLSK